MISLTWILGIVGTLGIGGCIAVYFLFPALVPVITAALGNLIRRFLACGWCKIIAGGFLIFFVGWWLGHHKAELDCRAAELNSELAAQRQDNTIAQQAAADEANRAIDIEVTASEQHKKDLAFIASHAGDTACGFDPLYGDDAGGVPSNVHAPKAKPTPRAK